MRSMKTLFQVGLTAILRPFRPCFSRLVFGVKIKTQGLIRWWRGRRRGFTRFAGLASRLRPHVSPMAGNLMLENLRGFVYSRPPLIVFLIFLTLLALTLISFGVYVRRNESLRDPKVALDWNEFLERLARIDFCLLSSRNGTSFPTFNDSTVFIEDNAKTTTSPSVQKQFSFYVGLVIHPNHEFMKHASDLTHLSGSIYGFQLGYHGDNAKSSPVHVSFELRLDNHKSLNASLCPDSGLLGSRLCPDVTVTTCVHLSGPEIAFPSTPQTPRGEAFCASTESTSVKNRHARIEGHREIASAGWGAMPFCPRGPVVHTMFKPDTALTVYLSDADRAVIYSHLLHSSYFLLIMVGTALCYAVVKGGQPLDKTYQSVPLYA